MKNNPAAVWRALELLGSTEHKLNVFGESVLSLEKSSDGEVNRDSPDCQALEAITQQKRFLRRSGEADTSDL